MKTKPVTPYARLLKQFIKYCDYVEYRDNRKMFLFKRDELLKGYSLSDVYERTRAADQLGFDVILRTDADGLHVEYIRRIPKRPWNVR
jgi:hypothetical protein